MKDINGIFLLKVSSFCLQSTPTLTNPSSTHMERVNPSTEPSTMNISSRWLVAAVASLVFVLVASQVEAADNEQEQTKPQVFNQIPFPGDESEAYKTDTKVCSTLFFMFALTLVCFTNGSPHANISNRAVSP